MNRELPEPRDEGDKRVLRDVAEHGCHIVGVLADESGPAFAYSIGLFHNYGHPEILVLGLKHTLMQAMINKIRDDIHGGSRFVAGSRYSDIVDAFDCEFRTVHRSNYRELFGYGGWFYRGDNFPAVQCIWPDMQGHFPWEAEFDAKFIPLQPTYESPRN